MIVRIILYTGLLVVCCSSSQLLVNDLSLVDEINNGNSTWKAGVSDRFIGFSLDSFANLLGAFEPTKEYVKKHKKRTKSRDDLPEFFDLREKYPLCESLREIRDQGSCGSCWAFGASGVMSDRICIHSNQTLQTRISAVHLISCCKYCGRGCRGGWPPYAYKFWVKKGIPSGGVYGDKTTCKPYVFPSCDRVPGPGERCDPEYRPTPQCTNECISEYDKSLKEDLNFGKEYYYISRKEKKIMTEIYENGSVEVLYRIYADFPLYKSGVYQHITGKRVGLHAVRILGWGVENGVKYWLCMNSWNANWGDNGYFKIIRGVNSCGIEGLVVAGIPKLEAHNNIKLIE